MKRAAAWWERWTGCISSGLTCATIFSQDFGGTVREISSTFHWCEVVRGTLCGFLVSFLSHPGMIVIGEKKGGVP